MANAFNFQEIILKLQDFWSEKGCLIWQPYYTQVGAGTYNPATFLRVIGPEPWNVAYVEPSIRPDDGRYGENPYRMQQHYQFQVILKPDPGNPQEIYLDSLRALGINPLEHDIRFVEDNWESPALGAWGLGWEVWLDGQEITQYTYFQQAGGIELEPVSVELTYGLERIAMALQGSYDFRKIKWNDQFTYGDVNYMAEKEHSTYYFEKAEVDNMRAMFDLYEKEAGICLKNNLVLPAHDYVLKCSHTFNILDTRGAIGVTERQALFGRMRGLSRRVAEAYLEQRTTLEFPWLPDQDQTFESQETEQLPLASGVTKEISEPQDLLIEIGTEELPARDLSSAVEQLNPLVKSMFDDLHLKYQTIEVYGTPRRLVLFIKELSSKQEDREETVKGPPAKISFDKDGNPTKAAIGFAKGKGIDVKDLRVEKMDGGEYIAADIFEEGKSVFSVLPEAVKSLIENIKFAKSMRWNESGVTFSRPIRWLFALYGENKIRFEYAGLYSDNITHGLRFHEPESFTVESTKEYFELLAKQGIILDTKLRRQNIADQVQKLCQTINASDTLNPGLLDEVTNLIEAPTALLGNFDKKHLDLPKEVLIDVMKKHQRYFPMVKESGEMLPNFITVRNGGKKFLEKVAKGNEEVIAARFADANFFITEDKKKKIEEYLPKLKTLIFHPKLGSIFEKTERITKIAKDLIKILGVEKEQEEIILRAAHLCKADLVTNMVIEMTSLQGVMGKYYALDSGENPEVAEAIEEHYYPRSAGDRSPNSKAGLIVGLADRLDSISGLFAAGNAPTGTKDPFGIRRAAISIIQNLIEYQLDFDLDHGIEFAMKNQPIKPKKNELRDCKEFLKSRLNNYLLEKGFRYDIVAAVVEEQWKNPYRALLAIEQLTKWVEKKDWDKILQAYARCARITKDIKTPFTVNAKKLSEVEEKDLLNALDKVDTKKFSAGSIDDLFNAFQAIIPAIDKFFEKVLVMDKNEEKKNNRLGLLQRIVSLTKNIADLSQLEGF